MRDQELRQQRPVLHLRMLLPLIYVSLIDNFVILLLLVPSLIAAPNLTLERHSPWYWRYVGVLLKLLVFVRF